MISRRRSPYSQKIMPPMTTKDQYIDDYKVLSDKEKNSAILAVICGYIEDKTRNGILDDTAVGLVNALAKCFDISIRFKEGETSGTMKDKLKELLGGD